VILGRRNVWDTLQDSTVLFVRQGGMGVDVIFIVISTVHCGLVMTMETRSALEKELEQTVRIVSKVGLDKIVQ